MSSGDADAITNTICSFELKTGPNINGKVWNI